MNEIVKMANELMKHYSFDLYVKLYDACTEAGLLFAEQVNQETNTFEFWIEDDHWICEE